MTDTDQKLDFSLPPRASTSSPGGGKGTLLLLVVVALLGAANLVLMLQQGGGAAADGTDAASSANGKNGTAGLSLESQRQLALKLEGQGLNDVAADAWVDYLAAAASQAKVASAIWYRIGKLYQDAGAYDNALAAYYRCEALDPDTALKDEIGRRAQESLESMGKFAALKQELATRVSIDGTAAAAGDEIIAEIGPRKITRSELDQQIEASIENQLARFAARMPEEQLKQQKESMLKQFSSDSQRMQFLQSFVVQEILYRKARESKLTEKPIVRAQLQDMERNFLAQQMMALEIESKLNIVDSDLITYYEANKATYLEPESAMVSQIVVADEALAQSLAEELLDADLAAFAEKAKEVSIDDATRENGGEVAAAIQKGRPGQGVDTAVAAAVFETEAGKMIAAPVQTAQGHALAFVRERQPSRQLAFQEVRDRVYSELRSRKEQETEQQLIGRLRDEYNVVIHQSKFKMAEEGK
ncbi:MAG: peptidyl-prolyl cis-trans isomerase C [Verrucomicrobiales bacterium]|jgi:peptidyl-prolyl cis-trans isomerase C